MGNVSANRKAKKEKKLKDEAIAKEVRKKRLSKIILVLGASNSGKSSIIQQIISQNIIEDIDNIIQTGYKLKSFNVNEKAYSNAHDYSATTYQYLNEVYNKLNVMRVTYGGLFDMDDDVPIEEKKDSEKERIIAENSIKINYELLISGYIHDTEKTIFQLNNNPIPIDIHKLLIGYCPNEMAEAHIIGVMDNYWELWELNEFDRKIWNELYQYARGILFVVDVSGYNEFITVDGQEINKLCHSLNLFEDIVNDIMTQSKGKSDQPLNLFFNKYDIFKAKIQKEGLGKCPLIESVRECGDDEDYPVAIMEAIHQAFRDKMSEKYKEKQYYMHVTNAMDGNNVGKVFKDVVHITINSVLARGS